MCAQLKVFIHFGESHLKKETSYQEGCLQTGKAGAREEESPAVLSPALEGGDLVLTLSLELVVAELSLTELVLIV